MGSSAQIVEMFPKIQECVWAAGRTVVKNPWDGCGGFGALRIKIFYFTKGN